MTHTTLDASGATAEDPWATGAERRDAARATYRHSVELGAPLSGAELGRRHGRSPQWGRQIATAIRAEQHAKGPASASPDVDDRGQRHVDATPPAGGHERRHVAANPGRDADRSPLPVPVGVRRITTVAVTAVAVVAATVSFEHQRLLAHYAGEAWRAWLLPIAVDGLVLAASMTMLTRRRAGQPAGALAWLSLTVGLGTSLAANVVAADPTLIDPAVARRVVAAYPPLALALAWELLLQQHRPPPTHPA